MGRTLVITERLGVFSVVMFGVAHFEDPGPLVAPGVSSMWWACALFAGCLPILALFTFLDKTCKNLEPRSEGSLASDILVIPCAFFMGGSIIVAGWAILARISWATSTACPDSVWATTAIDHASAALLGTVLVLSVPTLRLWKALVVARAGPPKEEGEKEEEVEKGEETGEDTEEGEEEEGCAGDAGSGQEDAEGPDGSKQGDA